MSKLSHSRRMPGCMLLSTLFAIVSCGYLFFNAALSAQESSHSPGWVVISVPDYRALRARAFPAARQPQPPPVDATLSRGDYDLPVDADVASGHVTLTLHVLTIGWI